mmetsp:Transcript_22176/g.44642  ORF Transcript_22176/g.44642 Transcript_22176/m.44642 type:complete len:246 (+) Transcript_22176:495-1232(+)
MLVEEVKGDVPPHSRHRGPCPQGDASGADHHLGNTDLLAVDAHIPIGVRLLLLFEDQVELAQSDGHLALEAGVEIHEIVPTLEKRLLQCTGRWLGDLGLNAINVGGARFVVVRVIARGAGACRIIGKVARPLFLPGGSPHLDMIGEDHALHNVPVLNLRKLLGLGHDGFHRGMLQQPVHVHYQLSLLLVKRPGRVVVHRRQCLKDGHGPDELLAGQLLPTAEHVVHVRPKLPVHGFLSNPLVQQF